MLSFTESTLFLPHPPRIVLPMYVMEWSILILTRTHLLSSDGLCTAYVPLEILRGHSSSDGRGMHVTASMIFTLVLNATMRIHHYV